MGDVGATRDAWRLLVRGRVQGVGFRPFVFRLARQFGIEGWVRNSSTGVEIHAEGTPAALDEMLSALSREAPAAARIETVEHRPADVEGSDGFEIVPSSRDQPPNIRISPDLPVCSRCVAEMRDPAERRFGYPYINCTECGPRYSIIQSLPYDRRRTTMRSWEMCATCAREYADPEDRRFHAQPTACPECGPAYALAGADGREMARGPEAISGAADLLARGGIVAVKGIGGYHLACDAENAEAVAALRSRKFRKEKPFALLVRGADSAASVAHLDEEARALLESAERPIVVVPARRFLKGVAPGMREVGVMLPYAPIHYLLFDARAPALLVMTSGNRSSEPIAFEDGEAIRRLSGIADAFLVGERPIARRVEDSVVRVGPVGPTILRRSRGYAPASVCAIESRIDWPILAVGADLKNAITLVVGGHAYVSQHIGDLDHFEAAEAFRATLDDLTAMYDLRPADCLVVHDMHPEYRSTMIANDLEGFRVAVQHHEAHVGSVLAEAGLWEERVIGVSFDGTGFGRDRTIWGGEVFLGSLCDGFERVAHLRPARLPGGDAAARHPVQAAAGFLEVIDDLPDMTAPPFGFRDRYGAARALLEKGLRVFQTTSVGRFFDTAAALLGFTRGITYEGQAAIWLEQLACRSQTREAYPFPDLDYGPVLRAIVADRMRRLPIEDIARAFHLGLAKGLAEKVAEIASREGVEVVAVSGGVFQNILLQQAFRDQVYQAAGDSIEIRMNRLVPPNDGGISLGQAALVAARLSEDQLAGHPEPQADAR